MTAPSSTTSLPSTMRAWQFTSVPTTLSAALTLNSSSPLPALAHTLPPNHTLVRIAYTSLNPVDFKLPELPLSARLTTLRRPGTPCLDFSGTVASTARSDLKVGDRVCGKLEPPFFGAAAEYAVVGSEGCAKVPEGVDLSQAAGLGVAGLTAWQCIAPYLEKARRAIEAEGGKERKLRVFINGGSGGTGTFGIQIATALGASVTTTCSSRNTSLVSSLGATHVLDYTTTDVLSELTRLASTTGPFDLAVDNVGGATPLYFQSHQYLAAHASFVCVGATPGPGAAMDMARIFLTPGVLGGGKRPYVFLTCKADREGYERLLELMREGKLKTVVEGEVLEMEGLAEGFEKLKGGRTRGKIVVRIAGE